MRAKPVGLYVHIPFCVRKCNYCDFCSFPQGGSFDADSYISALCKEIRGYCGREITLDTVFFGGGTPSLLSCEQIKRIFDAISETFVILPDAEITLEMNPRTADFEKLRLYSDLGINRISIGLQSIHENELKILGRIHTYKDFLDSYRMVRKCGFNNVSVDLMYGIPEQTRDSFIETLRAVTALSPEHISLYGLILEPDTGFWEMRDSLAVPCEDDECDMYSYAAERLSNLGYEHYEISNYAISGRRSRHNMKYWNAEEYIGVGLSAFSYFDGRRYGNTKDMQKYLLGITESLEDNVTVDTETAAYEYVMLGLRLSDGISLSEYETRFGKSFLLGREAMIDKFIGLGYARIVNDRLSLTDAGMYVSNAILNELI